MVSLSPARILLVEDEPLWQEGIKRLLSLEPDFVLVDITDSYDTALAAYHRWQPDIILLDWKIAGDRDGLVVGNRLVQSGHTPERIILISGSSQDIIPANPFPFIPKPVIASQLVPAIRFAISPDQLHHPKTPHGREV